MSCIKLRAPLALYIGEQTTFPARHDVDTSSAPLTSFSQCHLGILAQLLAVAALPALPALQVAAARARTVAVQTLALFREAVLGHHADEENQLFPAVPSSAAPDSEADKVRAMKRRLTQEHRMIEVAPCLARRHVLRSTVAAI